MQIEDKLKALHQLQVQKTELENQVKHTESLIDALNAEVVDEFESRQIKSMKLEGVGNFVMRVSSYPKVYDHALLKEWLLKQGISWEVVSAFNAKKFQGFYNELLESKQPLPEGAETFTKAKIVITKGV